MLMQSTLVAHGFTSSSGDSGLHTAKYYDLEQFNEEE